MKLEVMIILGKGTSKDGGIHSGMVTHMVIQERADTRGVISERRRLKDAFSNGGVRADVKAESKWMSGVLLD